MRNAASAKFISSWQQRVLVGPYTGPPSSATLPRSHDARKKALLHT